MKNNTDSYNRIADKWHTVRALSPINKCIIEFADIIKPNGKILDVGCGTGKPITAYLVERGFFVTGIDVSARMLEKAIAQDLPNATFYLCDFFKFSPDEKFDAVIAFDSFFHFPKARQADIYRIVSERLNNGGYLLFTHGYADCEIEGEMYGEKFYYSSLTSERVCDLLKENGFVIETLIKDYKEPTSGERDLLIVARKANKER